MTENKKQHYIPQFYLKNFSQDGKQVFVYHLKSRKAFLSPIGSTCQDKFFYGKDGEFEKALSEVEEFQAKAVKSIVETRDLTKFVGEDPFNLLSFIMLQHTRTKAAKLVAENMVDFFIEHYFKPLMKSREEFKGFTPEKIDSLKITMPRFYKWMMGTSLTNIEGIFDLKPFLLINTTKKPFITSDSPVILNNYMKIAKRSMIGFQSPGLQIFCPLTSSLLLLLIDEDAYRIFSSSEHIIDITNESDVDNLNKLQLLNCLDIIIFDNSGDEKYIEQLHTSVESLKTEKGIIERSVKTTPLPGGGRSDIVVLHMDGFNHSFRFSFFKLNHDFNRKLQGKFRIESKKHVTATPIRNKAFSKKVSNRYDNLMKSPEFLENG